MIKQLIFIKLSLLMIWCKNKNLFQTITFLIILTLIIIIPIKLYLKTKIYILKILNLRSNFFMNFFLIRQSNIIMPHSLFIFQPLLIFLLSSFFLFQSFKFTIYISINILHLNKLNFWAKMKIMKTAKIFSRIQC